MSGDPEPSSDTGSPGDDRSTDGGATLSPGQAGQTPVDPGPDGSSQSPDVDAAVTVARPRDRRTLAGVYLKGLFMGAADTVPGMSGGTVALVTGIYDRLIAAVTAVDPRDIGDLARLHRPVGRTGLRETLDRVDAPFLVVLFAGVLTAVATVAGVVETLLETRPGVVYGFFFGLIAASAVVLLRTVALDARRLAVAVGAAVLVAAVSGLTGGVTSESLVVLFAAAAVAASAMVLPGVSGSFLLLVLGQYERFLGLVTGFFEGLRAAVDGDPGAVVAPMVGVTVFGAGVVTGVLSMSHAVGWALTNYRRTTLAALVGLLVGGLRLPAERVTEAVSLTPGTLAPVVGAAIIGAVALFLFDHLTDDLSY
jgi:Predicted membrane protein